MRRLTQAFLTLLLAAALVAGAAVAQDGEGESRFVALLEGMLSTADRQVTLTGLQGVFSSNPTVERVTVSDRDGPWLQIEDVEVLWNRTSLFRRTLDIDALEARQVRFLRRPTPVEDAGPEVGGALLPVDITIDEFNLLEIVLDAPVLRAAARLRAEGSAQVSGDVVAARMLVERQDRPGTLSADIRLQPQEDVLTANLRLSEPAEGLLADWLELKGQPAIAVTLAGSGPLADWRAELEVQAGGAPVLAGGLAVSRVEAGYRLSADLTGQLEPLAPDEYVPLLSGESRLAFNVLRGDDGAVAVQSATLRSDGVEFAATGTLTPDLVPASADVTLSLGRAGRTRLPFVPGEPSVTTLAATIGLDAGALAPWRADIKADGVESSFGTVGTVALTASGQARDLLDPAERGATFRVEGSAEAVGPADAALAEALGPTMKLTAAGGWTAGQPVKFENLQMVLTGATASFAGSANARELDGRFGASITDLARFAPIARRRLGASAQLQATGRVTLAEANFDVVLAGEAADLRLGIAPLDPLLAGTTRVEGGIARDGGALSFEAFTLANQQVSAELNGSLAELAIDLAVNARIAELSSVAPRAKGRAQIQARVSGTTAAPRVEAEASGAEIVLMGRPLTDGSARFSGVVSGPEMGGKAELAGSLAGAPLRGSATLSAGNDGVRTLDDMLLSVGESRASGWISIGADGLLSGELSAVSPDLSKVAPLFLIEASGMLKADITLGAENGAQSATISGIATDILYENIAVDTADLSGRVVDLFAAPRIEGDFAIRNLTTGGLTVLSATGTAQRQGETTALSMNARLADGTATFRGSLAPSARGLAVGVQSFAFARRGIDVSLAAPITVLVADGTAAFDAAALNAGSGRVTLTGRAGSALDLRADLASVPATLANAFAPDLGAEGLVSGTVVVTGTAAAPRARFNAQWQGASVTASRNAGLGSLAVTAEGSLADRAVRLTSRIAGAEGLAIQATGQLGTAPGAPLDVRVAGAVPLSLGNARLAERGAVLQGAMQVDIAVRGTASAPQFSGRVTSEGGGFVDPDTGIVLRNVALAASVSNNRLVIDRLTAQSGEGTVAAGGSVGLDPAGGFPVDITAQIRQARYVDGTLIASRFDADLTVTGGLRDGPVLGGSVFLDRTEITVPESLPRDSVAVDVEHRAAPAPVEETLAQAHRQGRGSGDSGTGAGGLRLNVTISAPRQIFVRGRGIDAELGGDLRLAGSTAALVADGAFEMRRGRLDIFTQRIGFDRGIVTFAGDLDPILDFSGTTQSQDIAITVSVAGRASDPEVTFSSVPELPQDEVLAHLIFERGIAELSPVQIARLADAAAGLGGGGGGLLNQLRATTGLDDLDIVTDEEGAPALAAGRYVSENVYIGVRQGTSGSSRVTIDLDITDDVKARAAVTPEGNSSLGVFFEREY